MPSLAELQERFSNYLASGDAAPVARGVPGECVDRLDIYLNNSASAFRDALRAGFPVIERLVGEGFFALIARRYVSELPPATPVLAELGAHFPLWLPRQPEVRAMPWIEDVARLEWALQEAYHAPDAPALDPAGLQSDGVAGLAERRTPLHPSVRILESRWPVARIWEVNQAGWTGDPEVSLDEGGVTLLVHRPPDLQPRWRRLTAGSLALCRALAAGEALGVCCEAALETQPDLPLGPVLAAFIRDGVICAPAS